MVNDKYPLTEKEFKQISPGDYRWCKKGTKTLIHRTDGPAYINPVKGTQIWIQDGLVHRDDGPAIIGSTGLNFWFYKNLQYSFTRWAEIMDKSGEEIVMLKLRYDVTFNGMVTNE